MQKPYHSPEKWLWLKQHLVCERTGHTEPESYIFTNLFPPVRATHVFGPCMVRGYLMTVRLAPTINNTICERCSGHWGVWELRQGNRTIAMKLEHSTGPFYDYAGDLHVLRNAWTIPMEVTDGMVNLMKGV